MLTAASFTVGGTETLSVSRETGQLGLLIQGGWRCLRGLEARPLLQPRYGAFEPDLNSLGAKNQTGRPQADELGSEESKMSRLALAAREERLLALPREAPRLLSVSREAGHIR